MRTLFVYNHPNDGSFCHALLDTAVNTVKQNSECNVINLDADKFNPVMSADNLRVFVLARKEPAKAQTMLEPHVVRYKKLLEKTEHLVFVFPIWWMLMPALTKGFIDKVIFPSIAYDYSEDGRLFSILNALSRVTVITTMNTPADVYETRFGNAVIKALLRGTFETIGVSDCHWLSFNGVGASSLEEREAWLESVKKYFEAAK